MFSPTTIRSNINNPLLTYFIIFSDDSNHGKIKKIKWLDNINILKLISLCVHDISITLQRIDIVYFQAFSTKCTSQLIAHYLSTVGESKLVTFLWNFLFQRSILVQTQFTFVITISLYFSE